MEQIKAKEITMVPIEKLVDHPRNNNKHSEAQIERLAKLIKHTGFRDPITVSNRSGFIIAGHARKRAAIVAGLSELPVCYQDFENDAEEYQYLTADNEIARWAELDHSQLLDNIKELGLEDTDLELFGLPELDLPEIKVLDEEAEDEVPENVETRCKRGDIWLLGDHRLMCGDSTSINDVEKLMGGEKADMVFTDPPYGIEYRSNWSKKFDLLENDNKILDIRPCIEAAREKICAIYVWTSHQVYHKWREMFDDIYKSTIIWYKKFGGMGDLKAEYGHNYEICIYSTTDRIMFRGERPKAVWDIGADKPDTYKHPTQKPVALAENAISHHSCNRVLDLFGGSGSTLIACEKTNRKCFMMELDEHYCDVILSRWEQYTGKEAKLHG